MREAIRSMLECLWKVSRALGHRWATLWPWEEYARRLEHAHTPAQALRVIVVANEPDSDDPYVLPEWDGVGAFVIPVGRGGSLRAYPWVGMLEFIYQKGGRLLSAPHVWYDCMVIVRYYISSDTVEVQDYGARARDYARSSAVLSTALGREIDLAGQVDNRWGDTSTKAEYERYMDIYRNNGLSFVFMGPARVLLSEEGDDGGEVEA